MLKILTSKLMINKPIMVPVSISHPGSGEIDRKGVCEISDTISCRTGMDNNPEQRQFLRSGACEYRPYR
jgi:hypothetical protein